MSEDSKVSSSGGPGSGGSRSVPTPSNSRSPLPEPRESPPAHPLDLKVTGHIPPVELDLSTSFWPSTGKNFRAVALYLAMDLKLPSSVFSRLMDLGKDESKYFSGDALLVQMSAFFRRGTVTAHSLHSVPE